MAKSYFEKLQDPRWQRRKAEILQRDGYTCTECNDTTNTLHVHHRYYLKGADPWEYPDEALVSLCKDCHQKITETMAELYQGIGMMSRDQIESLTALVPSIFGLLRDAKKPNACLTGWFIELEYLFEDILERQFRVKVLDEKPLPREDVDFP